MKHCGTNTLETSRLILRRFLLSDAENMFNNWANSENVTKFLIWPPYESVNGVREYIKYCIDEYKKTDNYNWCIQLKENGEAIGSISVVMLRDDTSEATVGYCLSEKYWHKGIMSEAFERVIEFLFDEVDVNRITATHDTNNPNSGKVMLKCGLKFEGILRQAAVNNQGVCDSAVYSILKSEYKNI